MQTVEPAVYSYTAVCLLLPMVAKDFPSDVLMYKLMLESGVG